jgi:RNA polymerase sigma-70 factor (ECF subfamily)
MTLALVNSDALLGRAAQDPEYTAPPETAANALEEIDALYAAHSPRIFRFLLASLRDRDLAETLTQETFVRAWTSRAQFRGDCSVTTWLTRLALNLLRDHTRTNRFRFWKQVEREAVDAQDLSTHLPSHGRSSEATLIAQQQLQLVWETVAGLSQRQRTVFLLRFVEELELVDIAEATGMPLSTVKTHLYRSLAIVRARHQPANLKSGRAAHKEPK